MMKWSPPDIDDYIDIFSSVPEFKETAGDQNDITTSRCYARGMSIKEVGIPRMPHGMKSRDFSKDVMSMETALKVLPKRKGRGRARMLEEREDQFSKFDRNKQRLDSAETSSTLDSTSVYDASETSSMFGDCEFSDSEDMSNVLKIPSRNEITLPNRPFFYKQTSKKYDVNSVEDFPLLGSNSDNQDSVNSSSSEYVTQKKYTEKRKGGKNGLVPDVKHTGKSTRNKNCAKVSPIQLEKHLNNSQQLCHPVNANNNNYSASSAVVHDRAAREIGRPKRENIVAESQPCTNKNVAKPGPSVNVMEKPQPCTSKRAKPVASVNVMEKSQPCASKRAKPVANVNVMESQLCINVNASKPGASVNGMHVNMAGHNNINTMLNWRLCAPCVVQLEGIPIFGDLNALEETLSNFGQIEDVEIHTIQGFYAIRYRFNNEDTCDWVVSSLHDTDMLFPGAQSVLVCFKVE